MFQFLRGIALIAVVLPTAFTTGAAAEPSQFLCTVDQTAGLHYDKQTKVWGPKVFLKSKYILRRLTDDDRDKVKGKWWALLQTYPKANWAFFEFGKDGAMPLAACFDNNESSVPTFECERIIRDASFNKDTRRFELIYHGAYVSQGFWEQFRREYPEGYEWSLSHGQAADPSKPDDLFIEIGKCNAD